MEVTRGAAVPGAVSVAHSFGVSARKRRETITRFLPKRPAGKWGPRSNLSGVAHELNNRSGKIMTGGARVRKSLDEGVDTREASSARRPFRRRIVRHC